MHPRLGQGARPKEGMRATQPHGLELSSASLAPARPCEPLVPTRPRGLVTLARPQGLVALARLRGQWRGARGRWRVDQPLGV